MRGTNEEKAQMRQVISNFLARLLKGTFPDKKHYAYFRHVDEGFEEVIHFVPLIVYLIHRIKERSDEVLITARQSGVILPPDFQAKIDFTMSYASAEAARGKHQRISNVARNLEETVVKAAIGDMGDTAAAKMGRAAAEAAAKAPPRMETPKFGALVDETGRFVWCCMDTFGGDPVFNCLVNNNSDKTGFYDVVLEDFHQSEQLYEGASTVLITKLGTSKDDVVEIRDFAPRFIHYDRIFRPFQLIRLVRRLKGDPRISIRIRPTFQYNSTDGYQTRGSQHVRFCGPKLTWRVTTNMPIRRVIEETPFLIGDEPVIIVFGSDESFTNSLSQVALEFETKTVNYWKQWCNNLTLPVEFQQVLMRAAMTLAMNQSEDCGGFLAALSLGLPLGPFSPSTRDSRVCRLLDECLALPVLRELGLLELCKKFLSFAKEICYREEAPQHAYNSWGAAQDTKREWAPYLAGFKGMGEVHHGGALLEDARAEATMSTPKRKAGPLDTLPPICAGAVVTSIAMYPVDVVRAICMSNPGTGAAEALKGFLEAHGVMGFVKQGLVAEVTRASISRAIKFFMQPIVHKSLYGVPETKGSPVSKGLAGAIGTVPEVLAISPLENIKLAAQLDKEGRFNGSADIAKHIMKTRGFGGLMIGYAGMQVRQCLWTGGFFLTLDLYKGWVSNVVSNKLAQDVLSGFAAGATGTAMNCWTDVCRSIVQKKALADTFDPSIPRPGAFEPYNPAPFFAEAAHLASTKGIGAPDEELWRWRAQIRWVWSLRGRGAQDGPPGRQRRHPGRADAALQGDVVRNDEPGVRKPSRFLRDKEIGSGELPRTFRMIQLSWCVAFTEMVLRRFHKGTTDMVWQQNAVIYGLLAISLVHAFFDIRLSQDLCTPKLCEKLEQYAHLACEAFASRSQLYKAFGGTTDRPPRLPSGAGFFDDDLHFFVCEDLDPELPPKDPSPPAVHTLTSVLCWAAADRLHRVAAHFFRDPIRAEHWQKKALEIHEEICQQAWNPSRGAFTTFWGGDRVGPSMLRLAELGFLSPEDSRFRGTVRAFEVDAALCATCVKNPEGETLDEDSIMSAYATCFTTNTLLWYSEALRSIGAVMESRRLVEALVRSSKHPGVLAEAIDLRSGEQWGNTPCTSALLSLLRVSLRLSRTWREAWHVLRGYFLMGTMTAWTEGLRMEEESEGVYGYTLTMGDNNWEKFQIWIDEDPDKVLHPPYSDEGSESIIQGPAGDVPQGLCWKISGAKEEVRFVNEVQFEALEKSGRPVQGPECLVAFGGDYVPPNTENDIMKMPVVNLNSGLEGQPGDKYRIRLYVQGAYKRLEWSKAKGVDAVAPLGRRRFQHKFSVIGDHSHWFFQEMQEGTKGVYSIEVQILKSPSNFQIYRDRDFDQGFYPDDAGEILGPDGCGHGLHWKLQGEVGDVFQITFERKVHRGEDKKSISWQNVGSKPVDFEERAKGHQYYIAGSWNDFKDCKAMKKEVDENGVVSFHQEGIIIGKSGTEAMQILLNRNWLAAVHPDRDQATQNDGHDIQGPDDGGAGKYWAIGADPQDDLAPGDHVNVHMEMSGGLPKRLWWEKYDSPNIHYEYLKAGSQRVFDRHMRLMGLIPWKSKDQPARLVEPPEWYGNGRDREDLKYKNLFVITEDMLGPQAPGNGAAEDG
eukprot:s2766_g6.t1